MWPNFLHASSSPSSLAVSTPLPLWTSAQFINSNLTLLVWTVEGRRLRARACNWHVCQDFFFAISLPRFTWNKACRSMNPNFVFWEKQCSGRACSHISSSNRLSVDPRILLLQVSRAIALWFCDKSMLHPVSRV